MANLLSQARDICRLLEIKPQRSKGQNFLINENIYRDLLKAADLNSTDIILEVGPGLGFLTAKLSSVVKRVVAVELDKKLASYLQMAIDAPDIDNIDIINEDILKFNLPAYFKKTNGFSYPYKIVANLPYNISSIFLRNFLSQAAYRPELMVLMLQQEVAQRIVAQAGEMSILSISVQYYAEAEIVRTVKAGNFWPEPAVDSAVIKIKLKKKFNYLTDKKQEPEDRKFFRLVRIAFSSKRKMLKNNLAVGLKLSSSLIEEQLKKQDLSIQSRAQDLSLSDWQKLFATLKPFMV